MFDVGRSSFLQEAQMGYSEQRQFHRYSPPEGAIATLKPFAEFGKINNISKGGLAFDFLSFSNVRNSSPEVGQKRMLDIFIPKRGGQPVTLPCRVIRMENKLLGSYARSVIPKKRCGVQFTDVGRDTATALKAFLVQCQKNGGKEERITDERRTSNVQHRILNIKSIFGILHMRVKVVYTFDERNFGQTCSVSQPACNFFMRML